MKRHATAPSYRQVARNAEAVLRRAEHRARRTEAIGQSGENTLGLNPYVGYYDKPGQAEPVYDPGWGATPCLICWEPLGGTDGANEGGNIRTHGLLGHDGNADLSLFFRTHIRCADEHPEDVDKISESVAHGGREVAAPRSEP